MESAFLPRTTPPSLLSSKEDEGSSLPTDSGVFSRTIGANGLTLGIAAVYAKSWSWEQSNTVRVTVNRVDGIGSVSALMLDESAVLHPNGSDFVLATSRVSPPLPGYYRVNLAKPLDLTFSFSNDSYTSNALQGKVYSAHIAVSIDMLILSNRTSTRASFTDGLGDMLISLDTEPPNVHIQGDSLLYLTAAEVVGFAGILFVMKAVKL